MDEIDRIVSVDEIQKFYDALNKIQDGREAKSERTCKEIAEKENKRGHLLRNIHSAEEDSQRILESLSLVNMEINRNLKRTSELQESHQYAKHQFECHLQELNRVEDDLKRQMRLLEDQRMIYKEIFGVELHFPENSSEEIDIIVYPTKNCKEHYTVGCRKDRSRQGLRLQVDYTDPVISGFNQLEKMNSSNNLDVMQTIAITRHLYKESCQNFS